MNYDHLNKIHDLWRKDIVPHFVHVYTATSFDDYLRKFSFLPSGKWLHDMDKIKLSRIPFAVDPEKFVKKYKKHCVTYNAPTKPEDGLQRVIYQMSPTLHVEAGFWLWMENEIVQSYAMLFTCYHEEAEYFHFMDEVYKMRREGNTEDKPTKAGFAGFQPQLSDTNDVVKLGFGS